MDAMIDLREKDGGIVLALRVQPRAARSEIAGGQGTALKIRVAAPPVDGAANAACIECLAAWLGVRRAQVKIVAGAASRNKTVRVEGLGRAEALARLEKAAGGRL